jgi:hypothetical protein
MDFEVAVIAVGLAREEALDLAPLCLGAQLFQARLGFGDDSRIALGLAEPDQLDRLVDLALDPAIAVDRPLQPGALAQQRLRRRRVVPQPGVFRLGVQLGEAPVGDLPVKDASSAAPTTSRCRRRPPVSQRAYCLVPHARSMGQKSPILTG